MGMRYEKPSTPSVEGDLRLLQDIEADVFELWIGVSRLMSRLREGRNRFKTGRRAARRSSRRSSSSDR